MRDLSYYDFEDPSHESFTRKELKQHDYPDENGMFPSLNELKRRVIAERERLEAEEEYKRYADLALAEEERERAIALAQETEHTDYDYYEDYLGDPGYEYCPDCGIKVLDEGYHISTSQIICRCSPLYPDLRPSSLSQLV